MVQDMLNSKDLEKELNTSTYLSCISQDEFDQMHDSTKMLQELRLSCSLILDSQFMF